MNLKEEKLPFESFIGGWHIPKETCDKIINFHKTHPNLHSEGKIKGLDNSDELIINHEFKESIDIGLSGNDTFLFEYNYYLNECLKNYEKKYETNIYLNTFSPKMEPYNIQYYPPGGGFKKWHCERSAGHLSKRMLVFMTYLNDVPNGGTEFKFQKIITKAKKGLTLIWPSDFTHLHKGQVSNKHEKYVITGWFSFI
jgi:hypothetical protein